MSSRGVYASASRDSFGSDTDFPMERASPPLLKVPKSPQPLRNSLPPFGREHSEKFRRGNVISV